MHWCPTQFQRFIPGVEYRVHVVGEQRLRAPGALRRGRLPLRRVQLERTELPEQVAQRCRLLAASLGLELAGIDLRFGSDGRWYCWEANTSPAYSSFDGADHAIATALAEHLVAGW